MTATVANARTMVEAQAAYVESTTVTVAGTQYGEIDLIGWGSDRPMISLHIGPVLCRAGQPYLTVPHVAEVWRGAAVLARKLPKALPRHVIGRPSLEQQVTGVVLKLGAEPGGTQRLVPPTAPGGLRKLEIRVGPVTWLVLDQAAWRSITDKWLEALALVKPQD
ncbi:hypothetical protein [Lentzea terrae]|uniref:hypothetical protein n=1 Tax=Lentzea terrae TaxID=2200761 RepID=UPI00130049D6|nr:hypothetical protein [Lentzea terrae]